MRVGLGLKENLSSLFNPVVIGEKTCAQERGYVHYGTVQKKAPIGNQYLRFYKIMLFNISL